MTTAPEFYRKTVHHIGIEWKAVLGIFKKVAFYYRNKWFFGLMGIFMFLCVSLLVQELYLIREGGVFMRDFEVYHRAAGRLLDGANLFRIEDGHYAYKYSPTAAIFFTPFSLLPQWLANLFYWLFLAAAATLGLLLSVSIADPGYRAKPQRTNRLVIIAFLIMLPHIATEIGLGQVNYLLMVAFVCVAWLFIHKKAAACGTVLAFTVFIKPFGLIVVPYFLLKRRFREAGWFLFFGGVFFLLPVIFFRSWEFVSQQHAWVSGLFSELALKRDLMASGNHTIFSMLARFSPLSLLDSGSSFFRIYPSLLLALIGIAMLWVFYRGRNVENGEALDFAMIFALVPLLSYTTDNAFGFTELAVVVLLFNYERMSAAARWFLVPALAFVGFDVYFFSWWDTVAGVGSLISVTESYSLLGIGTLTLILIMSRKRLRAQM